MLFISCLLAACSYHDVPCIPHAELFAGKTQFSIGYGQTFCNPVLDLGLQFHEVVSDSRCPVDVRCIWEGEVTVSLNAVQNEAPIRTFALTSTEPVSEVLINEKSYIFTLVRVTPAQKHSNPPEKHEYVLELIVEPKGG